ncbi:hypothetical protein GCM10012320_09970 [Sinomonas cellulolyticus]|nr:hypothetical protein GCM10012320_09970 [Sinomonas sp. KCTC 49339]
MRTAGPAAWMPAPEPMNRPAPIALPRPIMVSWRGDMECPSRGAGVVVDAVPVLSDVCIAVISVFRMLRWRRVRVALRQRT